MHFAALRVDMPAFHQERGVRMNASIPTHAWLFSYSSFHHTLSHTTLMLLLFAPIHIPSPPPDLPPVPHLLRTRISFLHQSPCYINLHPIPISILHQFPHPTPISVCGGGGGAAISVSPRPTHRPLISIPLPSPNPSPLPPTLPQQTTLRQHALQTPDP